MLPRLFFDRRSPQPYTRQRRHFATARDGMPPEELLRFLLSTSDFFANSRGRSYRGCETHDERGDKARLRENPSHRREGSSEKGNLHCARRQKPSSRFCPYLPSARTDDRRMSRQWKTSSERLKSATEGSDKDWRVAVDCAQFKPTEVKVRMDGDTLHVNALRDESGSGYTSTMGFSRTVTLPRDVDTEHMDCYFSPNTGQLVLTAPKESCDQQKAKTLCLRRQDNTCENATNQTEEDEEKEKAGQAPAVPSQPGGGDRKQTTDSKEDQESIADLVDDSKQTTDSAENQESIADMADDSKQTTDSAENREGIADTVMKGSAQGEENTTDSVMMDTETDENKESQTDSKSNSIQTNESAESGNGCSQQTETNTEKSPETESSSEESPATTEKVDPTPPAMTHIEEASDVSAGNTQEAELSPDASQDLSPENTAATVMDVTTDAPAADTESATEVTPSKQDQTKLDICKEGFSATFDVENFAPESIHVKVEGRVMTLSAERVLKNQGFFGQETMIKSIFLPHHVDPESLKCVLKNNGQLVISVA